MGLRWPWTKVEETKGPKVAARRPARKPDNPWKRRGKRAALWLGLPCIAGAIIWHLEQDRIVAGMEQARVVLHQASIEAGLAISDIEIIGRDRTPPTAILSALDARPGDPLFAADLKAAREALVAIPWVERAEVSRQLPGTIRIALTERTPLAVWDRGDRQVLIDLAGRELGEIPPRDPAVRDLPRVSGLHSVLARNPETGETRTVYTAPPNTAALLKTLQSAPDLLPLIDHLDWVGGRRWDVVLNSGTRIKFPEQGIEPALQRLMHQQAEHDVLDKGMAAIDLRLTDRTILQTAESGALRRPIDPDQTE
ncbi:MAG: hypothetical protein Alpg2KO_14020 [Alphaproteobacteria bacterium]